MAERIITIERTTHETQITLTLNLDGQGRFTIDTGSGFFDHMLNHLARHSLFNLTLKAAGDLHVDAHHTVEDVAICLGEALAQALGEKKGIGRFGWAAVPMEDSLAQVAVDLGGRPYCVYNVKYRTGKIGDFDVELVAEFLRTFANNAKINLHVNVPYGSNNHHLAEAIFKALGLALAQAVALNSRCPDIPSTKGIL